MKKLFLISLFAFAFSFANAQYGRASGTSSGNVDSAAVGYATVDVSTAGALTIQINVTKTAVVGGASVAGYIILQGADSAGIWSNVATWDNYTNVAQPGNVFQTDTFTLANAATQTYTWTVETHNGIYHPYLKYRAKIVMTTSKVRVDINRNLIKVY